MRHYIAVGSPVCHMIEKKAYDNAGVLLTRGVQGTILAFNPLKDSLIELLKTVSGQESRVLTTEELDEIMRYVDLERPIYTVGYESMPYEKLSEFFTEHSIKELTEKEILKCI